jgi:hypothetical protein
LLKLLLGGGSLANRFVMPKKNIKKHTLIYFIIKKKLSLSKVQLLNNNDKKLYLLKRFNVKLLIIKNYNKLF